MALGAAALGAALLLVIPVLRPAGAPGAARDPMELARSLSQWEAPLDFLLEVPGAGLYESSLGPSELAFELPPLILEGTETR